MRSISTFHDGTPTPAPIPQRPRELWAPLPPPPTALPALAASRAQAAWMD